MPWILTGSRAKRGDLTKTISNCHKSTISRNHCHSNLKPDYVLTWERGKGVLVVSVSYTGVSNFYWQFRGIGNPAKGDITAWTIKNPLDWNSPPGRLAYIELPVGEYEFYKWLFPTSGGGSVYSQPFSIKFKVLSGKATYVGNLHLDLDINTKGMLTYSVAVYDQSNRDLELLYTKLPNVHSDQIIKSVGVLED